MQLNGACFSHEAQTIDVARGDMTSNSFLDASYKNDGLEGCRMMETTDGEVLRALP